jgi:hypothetical protein
MDGAFFSVAHIRFGHARLFTPEVKVKLIEREAA